MQDFSEAPVASVDRFEHENKTTVDMRAPLRLEFVSDAGPLRTYTPVTKEQIEQMSLLRLCRINDAQWGSLRPRASQLQRKVRRPALGRFMALRNSVLRQYRYAAASLQAQVMVACASPRYVVCSRSSQSVPPLVRALDIPSALRLANAVGDIVGKRLQTVSLHPTVLDALAICAPRSMRVLLMHAPTFSEDVPGGLVYSQTLYKATRAVYTRTTPGKYLREHFPQLTDEEVRDIVARYAVSGENFGIVNTMPEMLEVLQNGPASCMRADAEDFSGEGKHPYEVYAPELGWGMAYMRGVAYTAAVPRYDARALVNHGSKTFVRTYKRAPNDGYSPASEEMQQWLLSQGFRKADSWSGRRLARIPLGGKHDARFLMPYIDGANQQVYQGPVDWLTVGDTDDTPACVGQANVTEGYLGEARYRCVRCNDGADDTDSMLPRGSEDSDDYVCSSCFTRGPNRNGDYDYVVHHSGDYVIDADDAVRVNGEWYHTDDEDNYYCEYSEKYVHIDDTFECAHDGNWYARSVEHTNLGEHTIADHNLPDYMIRQIRAREYGAFVECVQRYTCGLLNADVVYALHQEMGCGAFPWDDADVVEAYTELAEYYDIAQRDNPNEDEDEDDDDDAEAPVEQPEQAEPASAVSHE